MFAFQEKVLIIMRPINGLYILRLAAVSSADPFGGKDDAKDKKDVTKAEDDKQDVGPSSALVGWRLLCRLRFDGSRCGTISGTAKILCVSARTGEVTLASSVATLGTDGTWSIDGDGTWSVDAEGSMNINFTVHIDHLDAHLFGTGTQSSQELSDIALRFQGTMSGGFCVGKVALLQGGLVLKSPVNDMRLVMQEVTGSRCTACHDPVDVPSCTLASSNAGLSSSHSSRGESSSCGCVQYCSAKCRDGHATDHQRLCHCVKPYANDKGCRCTATYQGKDFSVYWRSLGATSFTIFVDAIQICGSAYEVFLDLLIESRLGSEVTFKGGNDLKDHEVVELNHSVYEAVIRSAIQNGTVVLAATCLNHLHVWCDNVAFVERQYLSFYDVCVGGGWEGQRVISTLSEYVMLVRPMFECATVLIEAALKSMVAGDFWYRLENAKGVLISLYNINGSVTFTPSVSHLRNTIVPEQQRETLLLLARVFIMMAVRTPKDQSVKMLRRAEECYTDAMEEDRCRNNFRRMGYSYVQLSALYLMFPDNEDKQKAITMREQGLQFLAQSILRQSDSVVLSAITSTIGLMEELGSGMK